jgi:hypothetical protein
LAGWAPEPVGFLIVDVRVTTATFCYRLIKFWFDLRDGTVKVVCSAQEVPYEGVSKSFRTES